MSGLQGSKMFTVKAANVINSDSISRFIVFLTNFQWNIATTVGQIALKFDTDTRGARKMTLHDFPSRATSRLSFVVLSETSRVQND